MSKQTAETELKALLAKIFELRDTADKTISTFKDGFRLNLDGYEEVFTLLHELNELNTLTIGERRIAELKSTIQLIENQLKAITTFNPAVQNAQQNFQSYIYTTGTQYDALFSIIAPIVSYTRLNNLDTLSDIFSSLFREVKESANSQISAIETMKIEADRILEGIKKAAGVSGVANHAGHFVAEAKSHKIGKNIWLAVTGLLAVGLLATCWHFVQNPMAIAKEETILQVVPKVLPKLIFFSILYYSIIWAGRQYKTHYHNYVVNRHRVNALSTFETFVNAANNDEQTQNAILLKTTESIFSQQPTGFIGAENEAQNPSQIIEIVKNLNSKP